ncbi:MAG: hypothetical protein ACSLE8_18325 [Rhodococcus sp. (in: high G+C Gram-positive bacteria)]
MSASVKLVEGEVCRPILVVIDGTKALAKAVREIFDRPVEPAGGSAEGAISYCPNP